MSSPVERFTAAIESATVPTAEAFASDAVLDATVPNWRFQVRGAENIEKTFPVVRGPRPVREADPRVLAQK